MNHFPTLLLSTLGRPAQLWVAAPPSVPTKSTFDTLANSPPLLSPLLVVEVDGCTSGPEGGEWVHWAASRCSHWHCSSEKGAPGLAWSADDVDSISLLGSFQLGFLMCFSLLRSLQLGFLLCSSTRSVPRSPARAAWWLHMRLLL